VLGSLFLLPSEAWLQSLKPTTLSELVTYAGADREQVLYGGAKAEGKVVWYTSLAGESYKSMVKAFEAKYPGVKVEAYRGSGHELTTRMMEEAKARKSIVDAVETTEANLMFMREAFLLRPYYSPYFASYPEDAKEKSERGLYFWGIARESYIGFAYNKKLLSKNAIPKNYEGLLHPELKGRMGMSVSDQCFLADYLLGPEGQGVLEKFEYGSAAKNLGFKRWRPDHGVMTDKYEKELERWEKLLKEISRKGG
jgi:iron(III) transport system substrate-binding protein